MDAPLVGIVMGSQSDWDVMKHAALQLKDFGVPFESRALSAHRTPDLLLEWIDELVTAGARCFIAGAANAGLFAVSMLALDDTRLATALSKFRAAQVEAVKAIKLPEV